MSSTKLCSTNTEDQSELLSANLKWLSRTSILVFLVIFLESIVNQDCKLKALKCSRYHNRAFTKLNLIRLQGDDEQLKNVRT